MVKIDRVARDEISTPDILVPHHDARRRNRVPCSHLTSTIGLLVEIYDIFTARTTSSCCNPTDQRPNGRTGSPAARTDVRTTAGGAVPGCPTPNL